MAADVGSVLDTYREALPGLVVAPGGVPATCWWSPIGGLQEYSREERHRRHTAKLRNGRKGRPDVVHAENQTKNKVQE